MIFVKLWEEEEPSDGAVEDLVVIHLSSETSVAIPSVECNFLCLNCDTKVLLHQREELAWIVFLWLGLEADLELELSGCFVELQSSHLSDSGCWILWS